MGDLRPDHWPGFISCPVTPYPTATTTAATTTTKATTTEPPVCDEPGLQKCYADLVFGSTSANAVGGTAMCDLVDATTTCVREKIVGCAASVVEQYKALLKPVTDLACKDQGDCVAHPVCTGEILTTTTAKPTACEPWCMGNSHAWSNKCTWKKYKHCEQCTAVEKPEGCRNWCAGNSHDWKAKCTWKNCKQCTV